MEQSKARDNIMKTFGKVASESEESTSIELQQTFEINNSALHYFHAVGNYRPGTATKCAKYTSVVKMVTLV